MKRITLLAVLAVLAAQTLADNCHTFSSTCGDDGVCPAGASTTKVGACTVDFCNDASKCTCDSTLQSRVKRTRTEYSYLQGGATYYCITSAYTDQANGCCNCGGGVSPCSGPPN